MRITMLSLLVENQARALAFYTDVLGFKKKSDIPAGEYRWLTVVSPEGHPDVELSLEPNSNPAVPAREYQRALYDAGIPAAMFTVDNVLTEYRRLKAAGVHFTQDPTTSDGITTAIFDDTCGNLIMIAG